MKKNKKLLFVVIGLVLLLTGCTKQMKDANGKVVQDETTKQALVENILCRPVELKESYEKAIEEKKESYDKLLQEEEITKKEHKKLVNSLLDLEKLPVLQKVDMNLFGQVYL